jgi:uncharacterized membrane protein (DUF485 family)
VNANISCAIAGCTNPVIGQCSGYESNCGKFYCSHHSDGSLCSDCGNRKAVHEKSLAIQQDYLRTLDVIQEKASQQSRSDSMKVIGATILVCGVILFLLTSLRGGWRDLATPVITILISSVYVGGMVGIILGWLYRKIRIRKLIREFAHDFEKQKPGFAGFFNEWQYARDQQALKKGFALAESVIATAFAVVETEGKKSTYQRKLRDAVDKSVDDELKRRGL